MFTLVILVVPGLEISGRNSFNNQLCTRMRLKFVKQTTAGEPHTNAETDIDITGFIQTTAKLIMTAWNGTWL